MTDLRRSSSTFTIARDKDSSNSLGPSTVPVPVPTMDDVMVPCTPVPAVGSPVGIWISSLLIDT